MSRYSQPDLKLRGVMKGCLIAGFKWSVAVGIALSSEISAQGQASWLKRGTNTIESVPLPQSRPQAGIQAPQEQRVGSLPALAVFYAAHATEDGSHFACVAPRSFGRIESRLGLVVDGQDQGLVPHGNVQHLIFSPNGKRYACVSGSLGMFSSKFVTSTLIDRKKGPDFGAILPGTPVFSPDSEHVAYGAKKDNKCFMVVDGQAGAAHDDVGKPVFSREGGRVAYAIKERNKWRMVVDAKVSAEFDDMGAPAFSPDSKRVAYGVKRADKWLVVVDDKPSAEYDSLLARSFDRPRDPPVSDADRAALRTYLMQGVWEGRIEKDRKAPHSSQDPVWFLEPPVFSPDSKHVAFSAKQGEKWYLVLDDQPGPEYTGTGSIVFSPDSRRVAYQAKKGDKNLVVIDGQPSPDYDEAHLPVFSPDSKRVVYQAKRDGKCSVVVDGQHGPECDKSSGPVFSPDSKRVAYWFKKGEKVLMIVDGQTGPEYDGMGKPVFSSDSKHIAYQVARKTADKKYKLMVIVDDLTSPEYARILCGPQFRSDGLVEFLATKKAFGGYDVYRVTALPR